ncbi:putative exoglucanase GH6D [Madurella mycetomatis]|uniref:Exoglucanase GH6D n=1 Tax=Madurella mycetomatis TaxID=100816 RepID=A0A175VY53_9PEZI|nr:putative exoglucanase GH6D [Madurella mycetomatis]
MLHSSFLAAALAFAAAPGADAILRFSCSELVTERLDPLVFPGAAQSPHLHQIVGGNMFNITMDANRHNIGEEATCTTCTFAEDFSNYWTATLFFRARNGSFIRVPQRPNVDFDGARGGGMTVYYTPSYQNHQVTAFRPGFRMIVGNPMYRTAAEASRYRQMTFTCLETLYTRTGETTDMPRQPCREGIMANVRFPTCWDGQNLDSPDHASHVAYPSSGTFESGGPCPASHPVRIPQLFYEVIWDTRRFNDRSLWPEDGSQPFVWSYGDYTGYGTHGDYVFGWRGDSLQRAMDANCDGPVCPQLRSQSISTGNQCTQQKKVPENIDGWLSELPGGIQITGPQPATGGSGSNPGNGGGSNPGNGGSNPGNGGCEVQRWGQCGGQGWSGCTSCAAGSTCQAQNQWYSQCL